jgi:hypothetical protein
VTDTITTEIEQEIAEYLNVLRQEPTAEEAVRQERLARESIMRLTSKSTKPKPQRHAKLGRNASSSEFSQYTNALADWEKAIAEWRSAEGQRWTALGRIESACKIYLEDFLGVNELPDWQAAKVKAMAWDRGHSSGLSAYFWELEELMELFNKND